MNFNKRLQPELLARQKILQHKISSQNSKRLPRPKARRGGSYCPPAPACVCSGSWKLSFYSYPDGLQDPGISALLSARRQGRVLMAYFCFLARLILTTQSFKGFDGGIFHLPVLQLDTVESCCALLAARNLQLIAADPR